MTNRVYKIKEWLKESKHQFKRLHGMSSYYERLRDGDIFRTQDKVKIKTAEGQELPAYIVEFNEDMIHVTLLVDDILPVYPQINDIEFYDSILNTLKMPIEG